MSISITSLSNIQIRDVFQDFNEENSLVNSFPKDSIIQVEVINGKKEGKGKVLSRKSILLAELNFKNDNLDGHCLFLNKYGERVREVNYENGVAEGWYCEFENNSISKMGINKNGKKYCELRKHSKDSHFLEEVVNSKVISVCKYSKEYKKDGLCTLFKDDRVSSVVRFENGVEKEKKYEFDGGKMIEFDKEGMIIYRGSYKGDVIEGFRRYGNGCCYEYLNGRLSQIDLMKKGIKKGYQLIGDVLKEYDVDGKLVYEGGFEGSAEDSFVWSGEGSEYLRNGMIVYGLFSNGKRIKTIREIKEGELTEYDNENHIVYIGEYSKENLKRSGKGKCFVYDGNSVKEVYHCENGEMTWKAIDFEGNTMSEYNENGELIYQGDYIGDVRRGFVREGEGQEFKNDVQLYVGEWRNGIREGMGRSYKDSLVYYKGEWKNGLPNGKGELMNGFEVKYKGVWKNGLIEVEKGMWFDCVSEKMCGLYDKGMKKYVGDMKNGLPHGQGIYYDHNGNVKYEGEWKNGCIEIEKGFGFDYLSEKSCSLYENGMKKYVGEMNDGIPDGQGVYYDRNGSVKYWGYWIDGELHVKGSEWFCYKSGEIEMRIMRTLIEKSKEALKEVMKWMKTKTGKIVMGVSLTMIVLILLIVGIVDGWFAKLFMNELVLSGNNNKDGDYEISGYLNVKSIVVKYDSLKNLNSLTIKNNPKLESIEVEDGSGSGWDDYYDTYHAPFENVKSVIITSKTEFDF